MSFQLHNGGTITPGYGTNLNHSILAVDSGDSYFKAKNSWGASWKMNDNARCPTRGTACGIRSDAPTPQGTKTRVVGRGSGDKQSQPEPSTLRSRLLE